MEARKVIWSGLMCFCQLASQLALCDENEKNKIARPNALTHRAREIEKWKKEPKMKLLRENNKFMYIPTVY